jgi:hypothetical protein
MSDFTPQRIGTVLQSVIDDLDARRKIDEARVVEVWMQLVGGALDRVTEAAWMKGGVLHVKIRSSAWRHEIYNNRSAWRRRLNEAVEQDLVSEIKLH